MKKSAELTDYERGLARGRREGRIEGFEYMLTCCYLRLSDLGLTQDEIYKVHMCMNEEIAKIRRLGTDYFQVCKDKLQKEYGIRFHWRQDRPLNAPIAPRAVPSMDAFLKGVKLDVAHFAK